MLGKRKRSYNNVGEDLHRDGYVVHRKVIDVTESMQEKFLSFARMKSKTIFNHNKRRRRNDYKRKQAKIKSDAEAIRDIQLFLKDTYPLHTSDECVVLHSYPGCQEQSAHCDYVPDKHLATTDDENFPLAALFCLMPGTTINLWPGSHRLTYTREDILSTIDEIPKVNVKLEPGDVLIFRGDLVHGGAAYDEENVRLHTFLDSRYVPRDANCTWLISQHAPEELDRIIQT